MMDDLPHIPQDPRVLNIHLLGRAYRIACPPDEEVRLLEAAAYLDEKLNEARNSGKIIGSDRLTLMVALNLAAEVMQLRVNMAEQEADMQEVARRLQGMVDSILHWG